jgi:hypothetical protein
VGQEDDQPRRHEGADGRVAKGVGGLGERREERGFVAVNGRSKGDLTGSAKWKTCSKSLALCLPVTSASDHPYQHLISCVASRFAKLRAPDKAEM